MASQTFSQGTGAAAKRAFVFFYNLLQAYCLIFYALYQVLTPPSTRLTVASEPLIAPVMRVVMNLGRCSGYYLLRLVQ